MNLLLVNQPVTHPINQHRQDIGIPLGLLYLSSYLKQNNPDVNITLKDYRLDKFLGKRTNYTRTEIRLF